jgi:3-oxoacyl-[acyl-carrier protein] reductase
MDLGISGKKALVLGASRGLGRASAEALAAEGVAVWGAARSFTETATSNGITTVHVDFSDSASVAALKQRLIDAGGVDILVNNTGGPKPGSAQSQTSDDWRAAFETLALPVFELTAAALPFMLERRWGRVITIGSSGIVQPIANLALSNAVRGAIAGWSKTLASEVAAHGVTVNMVLPGRIDTDRVKQLDGIRSQNTGQSLDQVQEASRRDIPAGRYGRPKEFGDTVAFLASDAASYITGSMISVDGGMIRGL